VKNKGEMMENAKTKMDRFLNNICRVAGWNGIFNKKEVECLFENYSDLQFCNGHLRRIEAKPITDNCIKLYTVPA